MHEHVVGVLALAVEHDLVTGAAGLVLDHLDDSAPRSDDARALARGEIVALVAMALARGAEARALPTPAEGRPAERRDGGTRARRCSWRRERGASCAPRCAGGSGPREARCRTRGR